LRAVIDADPCCVIRLAGTVIDIWLVLTTVVGRGVLFQYTVVPGPKPLPSTRAVNEGPPAGTDPGVTVMIVSPPGSVISKRSGAGEAWLGVRTPTEAVPAVAIKFAGTAAANWELEMKVVANGTAFQVTTVLEANPDPFAVSVNAGPPVVALEGVMERSVSGAEVMPNVSAFEIAVPFCAVILADPGCPIRFAGTVADNCVALITVVGSARLFQ